MTVNGTVRAIIKNRVFKGMIANEVIGGMIASWMLGGMTVLRGINKQTDRKSQLYFQKISFIVRNELHVYLFLTL